MFKRIIRRAREAAEKHLPEELRNRGRQIAEGVLERVPERVRATIEPYLEDDNADRPADGNAPEGHPAGHQARQAEKRPPDRGSGRDGRDVERAGGPTSSAASPASADTGTAQPSAADDPAAGPTDTSAPVGGGWAPAGDAVRGDEYRVVVFGQPDDEASQRACALLQAEEIEHRIVDLRREPRTAAQIASVTGIMASPYVFIDGRHWGNDSDLETLRTLGDLEKIMARTIDGISDTARRIGGIHEVFDDSITLDNVVARLRKGHILEVDGLDCWLEEQHGEARVFHEGVPRAAAELETIAREIVDRVEQDPDLSVCWRFEPAVDLNH